MIGTPEAMGRLMLWILAAVLTFFPCPAGAGESPDGIELCAVIHVHSTFSSGRYSLEELVEKARLLGVDVLLPTDHDRVAMEYGVLPFRRLLKLKRENPSILKSGPERYLEEIARLNAVQAAVRVIPGVQSSPFYHWRGSPWRGDLMAHDYHKELLLVGMPRPEDYRRLPILHNGVSARPHAALIPDFAATAAGFLIAAALFFRARGRMRAGAALLALIGLAAMIDRHPFSDSRFDPYHGDQGIAPYQDVIDHVAGRGGLIFWAHPESNYPVAGVPMGPVTLVTGHYVEDLSRARGYTGFAALYGDTATITEPGALWDRILNEYARGERAEPVWGIAEADFHEESPGMDLDTFQTVIQSRSKAVADVLEALRRGRCYAVRKGRDYRLVLAAFEVRDLRTGRVAVAGDEIAVAGTPGVRLAIMASDGNPRRVSVDLVRGGELLQRIEGDLPLEMEIADTRPWEGRSYYRLEARGAEDSRLISNPIFVERTL
jgi:hypothetical protein